MSESNLYVFVNYRREDAAGTAGRLADCLILRRDFRNGHVFRDVSHRSGADLEKVLDNCNVMLALIGHRWLDEANTKRLYDETDTVRAELVSALDREMRIIPLLIDGTPMPTADQLPEALRQLRRRQAVAVHNSRIRDDLAGLLKRLEKVAVPAPHTIGGTRSSRDGLSYMKIPAGTFSMGAVSGDQEAQDDEKPRHVVEIGSSFYLSQTPVTVAAYQWFARKNDIDMPTRPKSNPGWDKKDHPIVRVTWAEAQSYCEWAGGRLPTEAEWEYAARGGRKGLRYPNGRSIDHNRAKYRKQGRKTRRSTEAGMTYPMNGFGLFHMAGNVREWVADRYDAHSYRRAKEGGAASRLRTERVTRGGSWDDGKQELRISNRMPLDPDAREATVGFRCVLDRLPPRPA